MFQVSHVARCFYFLLLANDLYGLEWKSYYRSILVEDVLIYSQDRGHFQLECRRLDSCCLFFLPYEQLTHIPG